QRREVGRVQPEHRAVYVARGHRPRHGRGRRGRLRRKRRVQLRQRTGGSVGLAVLVAPRRGRALATQAMKRALAVALGLVALFSERRADACGVSASGAPAGICDASEVLDEKASAAKNRIGVSYGYTSTVLFFDTLRAPTERHAA